MDFCAAGVTQRCESARLSEISRVTSGTEQTWQVRRRGRTCGSGALRILNRGLSRPWSEGHLRPLWLTNYPARWTVDRPSPERRCIPHAFRLVRSHSAGPEAGCATHGRRSSVGPSSSLEAVTRPRTDPTPQIRPKWRRACSMASRFSGGHGTTRRPRPARFAWRRVGKPRSTLT